MTPTHVNHDRCQRLARASAIVQLATIIQEEEGLDDNTAYILAEQELDAIAATEAAWSDQQPVAMLRILPTAWGSYWFATARVWWYIVPIFRRCWNP